MPALAGLSADRKQIILRSNGHHAFWRSFKTPYLLAQQFARRVLSGRRVRAGRYHLTRELYDLVCKMRIRFGAKQVDSTH